MIDIIGNLLYIGKKKTNLILYLLRLLLRPIATGLLEEITYSDKTVSLFIFLILSVNLILISYAIKCFYCVTIND
jgi:hypothetical protein